MCLARDPSGRLQIPPHDKPIKGESLPTMPPRAAPVKHMYRLNNRLNNRLNTFGTGD